MIILPESLGFDDVLIVPGHGVLKSRREADLVSKLTNTHPLVLKIPILSANMPAVTESRMAEAIHKLGGYGFLHRFMTIEENVAMFEKYTQVGVSLGINEDINRARALTEAGATVFLVDVAHGDSDTVLRFVDKLRNMLNVYSYGSNWPREIIVGNVATGDAVTRLEDIGVNAIKVGIGPGAACTTRTVAGAGRGQLSAIMECSEVANVPIIADGGIKNSGDIVKALAAGASSVMLGRLLAGCNESPEPGKYWGSASAKMNGHRMPEGVEGTVPRTGSLEDTLKPLLWGLRSGISYAGAKSVKDLPHVAQFERVANGVHTETQVRI